MLKNKQREEIRRCILYAYIYNDAYNLVQIFWHRIVLQRILLAIRNETHRVSPNLHLPK